MTALYSGFVNDDTASNLTTLPTLTTTATATSDVSGNPYTITASGADDPDYTISYVAGLLTVTPASLTITANNQTEVYSMALPAPTVTFTGLVNGDSAATFNKAPNVAPIVVSTDWPDGPVSGNPYALIALGAFDPDYNITYVPGTLTVTPAPATLTFGNLHLPYDGMPQAVTVNTSPAGLTGVTIDYSQNGTPVAAPTALGSYTVTASLDNPNYTANSITGTLNIEEAPVITWASPAAITYGTALGPDQLDATANVSGTFTYSPSSGTVLNAGNDQVLTLTFVPTESNLYATVMPTETINVDQAAPDVSVSPVNLIYGTELINSQLSGTATWTVGGSVVNVSGSFAYTSAAGTVPGAGNGQSESVTFTPMDSTDYSKVMLPVTINVDQAAPDVSVSPVNLTYGTELINSQLSGTATWTVGGSVVTVLGSFSYTSAADTVLGAGKGQSESVTFTPMDSTDYSKVTLPVTINVDQAAPDVSVNPVNLTYGTELINSQLSGTATWTVGGVLVHVPGSFRYTSAAGTVPTVSQSESVTFTPIDLTDYSAVTTAVFVNVSAPPIPRVSVTNVYWTTLHPKHKKAVEVLEVVFSGALDAGDADNKNSYPLYAATHSKKLGTQYKKFVPVSASYNQVVVTLTPRGKVPTKNVQLTIITSQVLDTEGRPIIGNAASGNYVGGPTNRNVVGAALPSVRASHLSARAVDALLLDGHRRVMSPKSSRPVFGVEFDGTGRI